MLIAETAWSWRSLVKWQFELAGQSPQLVTWVCGVALPAHGARSEGIAVPATCEAGELARGLGPGRSACLRALIEFANALGEQIPH